MGMTTGADFNTSLLTSSSTITSVRLINTGKLSMCLSNQFDQWFMSRNV